jgi:hypothetical protein
LEHRSIDTPFGQQECRDFEVSNFQSDLVRMVRKAIPYELPLVICSPFFGYKQNKK